MLQCKLRISSIADCHCEAPGYRRGLLVCSCSLELVGAEVLARWHSPGRGEIAPGEFTPLAESLDLIQDITEQVLDVVGDCVIDWRDKDLPSIQICVNLSGLDLKNGRILEVVESFLTRSRLPIHYLTLEITESWLMEDPNRALGLIHRLRDMGPRLAIDDFGTGYSALGQLIDFIRLCQIRSFLRSRG